jgi:hypothetical protein
MKELLSQENCLNCSSILNEEDVFCHHCGQKKLGHHDFTLRHLIVDSFADYFHFDGKFFTTLKSMFLHPGQMTNEFLAGKRVKFIQPFKLFLFISILYFIVIGFSGHSKIKHESAVDTIAETTADTSGNLKFAVSLPGAQSISIDKAREIVARKGIDATVDSLSPGAGWFSRLLSKRILINAIEGPERVMEKFVHNSSKVVFILIPLMALLMKLLYLQKKKLYFDHLIFALHFHAMLFISLIIFELVSFIHQSYTFGVIFFGVIVYLYWMMRKVYAQGRGRTIAKIFALFFGYTIIALPLFFVILFVVSMMI